MQFLFPWFLLSLLALAIPVIIHLFHFRRFKKVYFTNVRFLQQLQKETSSRKKLRQLILLALRCLAIIGLVFAFAQPFIPVNSKVKQGIKSVSIYIDNSFSMGSLGGDVSLVDQAVKRGREIVNGYKDEDRFQILTNDFLGKHQRMVSKEDALALLDEIKISPAVRKISEVFKRQSQTLQTSGNKTNIAFLISDFQSSTTDLSTIKDTITQINFIPVKAVEDQNVSIDSCWFSLPIQMLGQSNPLIIKAHNYGQNTAENVKVSLVMDGQEKPIGNLSIPAGASIIDTVNISVNKTGWQKAEIKLTDYPIQFDDSYFMTFNVAKQLNILCLNESVTPRYINAAFNGSQQFKLTNATSTSIDYSSFNSYQLIVCADLKTLSSGLAQELKKYMQEGGNVLIFPSANADINTYNTSLQSLGGQKLGNFTKANLTVGTVNYQDFIFKDVYENQKANLRLPSSTGYFPLIGNATAGAIPILSFRNGASYLSRFPQENGNLFLCSSPIDEHYNDLVKTAEVFIPMMAKMTMTRKEGDKIAFTIGKDVQLTANAEMKGEKAYSLVFGKQEFLPEQRKLGQQLILGVKNMISESGFYSLQDDAKVKVREYAFNYDRQESERKFKSSSELKEGLPGNMSVMDASLNANFTAMVNEKDQGIVLWRWFVLLALLALITEALLIRLWKGKTN